TVSAWKSGRRYGPIAGRQALGATASAQGHKALPQAAHRRHWVSQRTALEEHPLTGRRWLWRYATRSRRPGCHVAAGEFAQAGDASASGASASSKKSASWESGGVG